MAKKNRLLPLCGHSFHTDCILPWLERQGCCPLWVAAMLNADNSIPTVDSNSSIRTDDDNANNVSGDNNMEQQNLRVDKMKYTNYNIHMYDIKILFARILRNYLQYYNTNQYVTSATYTLYIQPYIKNYKTSFYFQTDKNGNRSQNIQMSTITTNRSSHFVLSVCFNYVSEQRLYLREIISIIIIAFVIACSSHKIQCSFFFVIITFSFFKFRTRSSGLNNNGRGYCIVLPRHRT